MKKVTESPDHVTGLKAHDASDLLTLVYEELRKLAAARMADEAGNNTLQPTALVHEAWLRLGGSEQPRAQTQRATGRETGGLDRPLPAAAKNR